MWLFILFLSLLIVSIVSALLLEKDSKYVWIPFMFLIPSIFPVVIMTINLSNKEHDEKECIKQYELLQEQVEMIKNNQTISVDYFIHLRNEINKFNEKIQLNRNHCDSKWVGALYSKDVANLELIENIDNVGNFEINK